MLTSCEQSSEKYSDEELETLEEAQKIHNEAMAIFSQTRPLLAELNEVRTELITRTGLPKNDTTQTNDTIEAEDKEQEKTELSEAEDGRDTPNIPSPEKALEQLNQAQVQFMNWMRNIYQVPHYPPIYGGEKAPEDPAIGADFDSNMLLTDMEFKQYPEDTSPEEILESQKKMKQDILEAQEQIKKAVEGARMAYIYGEEENTGAETEEGAGNKTEEGADAENADNNSN